MTHKRELVRKAVIAAIEARPVFVNRVFSTRLRSTEVGELPVAIVYALRETSEHADLSYALHRTAQIAVEVKGAANAEAEQDLADVLDALSAEVEIAAYADPTLGGLAIGLELVRSEVALDPSGNTRDGAIILTLNVLYRTERPIGA